MLTDIGGSGVAFQATREYRPGDPRSRIDWNRLAKTGDLSTVDLREERAAAVVILAARRARGGLPRTRSGRGLRGLAVGRRGRCALRRLHGRGEPHGSHGALAQSVLARARHGTDPPRPDSGRRSPPTRRSRPTPPDDPFFPSIRLRRLRQERLPSRAQVVVCSPVSDDYLVTLLQRLDASGHRVSGCVSPDPHDDGHPGRTASAPSAGFASRRSEARASRLSTGAYGPLRGDARPCGRDAVSVVNRSPPRLSEGLALGAGAVGALALVVSPPAFGPGVLGVIAVGVGLLRRSRAAVTLGAAGVFCGVLLAGLTGVPPELLLCSTASAVVAWDVATFAIDLGAELGRAAETRRLELVHAGASAGARARCGAVVGAVVYRLVGGGPALAPVALLCGAVVLAVALRP